MRKIVSYVGFVFFLDSISLINRHNMSKSESHEHAILQDFPNV